MAEVFFSDEQQDRPVDALRLRSLAEHVCDAEGVSQRAEVSLIMVDETTMADFNVRFRGVDGPTDVLAFPIDDPPGASEESGDEIPILLGDVLVCPEVAHRNAPEHAGTYANELDLLVVHGILHLLGYDHYLDAEAERMEARQDVLLEAFGSEARS